jgi:tRNA pseudouridine32 synthase / 23S rRNA pseudouridine746 synthase
VTIPILYEDDDILAVSKPEGLAAIPERHGQGGSLFEVLCAQRGERLYIVHRIDKETSGLIVFARHAEAHRRLNRQFETRAVEKTYLALSHGVIAKDAGSVDAPLRQFGSGRVAVDPQRGKPSTTEFRIVERFGSHTLVEARPRTGRRHQIRVHLYHLGHPIAGDPLYGDEAARRAFSRMMLHAWRLELTLPAGRLLAIEAPIPESFEAALDSLKRALG